MMIHFIRPWWLCLLIPAFIYLTWVIVAHRQHNPWKKVCDPHLLAALLHPGERKTHTIFYLILFAFYIIAIVALAGPAWKKTQLPIYRDVNSLMLVLDLSQNMQVSDLKPDRLTRAKFKIRDLINATPNTQMGLVVFTNESFVTSPLSKDANTLNALLDELQPQMMPILGSDIEQGISEGVALLKQAGVKQGNLLLITASSPNQNSWVTAKNIAQAGGHLNILGMLESNASNQATINDLQKLAHTGNGSFLLFSQDSADIQQIMNHIKDTQSFKDETSDTASFWQDAGPWFCLLLVPFALFLTRERVS